MEKNTILSLEDLLESVGSPQTPEKDKEPISLDELISLLAATAAAPDPAPASRPLRASGLGGEEKRESEPKEHRDLAPASELASESVSDPDSAPELEAELEPEPEPESEPEAASTVDAEPEPNPAPEPDPALAFEPDPAPEPALEPESAVSPLQSASTEASEAVETEEAKTYRSRYADMPSYSAPMPPAPPRSDAVPVPSPEPEPVASPDEISGEEDAFAEESPASQLPDAPAAADDSALNEDEEDISEFNAIPWTEQGTWGHVKESAYHPPHEKRSGASGLFGSIKKRLER